MQSHRSASYALLNPNLHPRGRDYGMQPGSVISASNSSQVTSIHPGSIRRMTWVKTAWRWTSGLPWVIKRITRRSPFTQSWSGSMVVPSSRDPQTFPCTMAGHCRHSVRSLSWPWTTGWVSLDSWMVKQDPHPVIRDYMIRFQPYTGSRRTSGCLTVMRIRSPSLANQPAGSPSVYTTCPHCHMVCSREESCSPDHRRSVDCSTRETHMLPMSKTRYPNLPSWRIVSKTWTSTGRHRWTRSSRASSPLIQMS